MRPLPMRTELPSLVEEFRDERWWREESRCVETALQAERFVEHVGFAACLTDARRPGPSLYVAVCGRRDAVLPRNVQKDPEASLTWTLKDDVLRRGKVYYAKLSRGKAMFLAPRMIPYFRAVWGIRPAAERTHLSRNARILARVLRREWELSTADLRELARIEERPVFSKALDELQAAMIAIPSGVTYEPRFTYTYALALGRFPTELRQRIPRHIAVREIARCFLTNAGMTMPGELARVVGLSRAEAGLANRALVAEGVATSPSRGVYVLATGFATRESRNVSDVDTSREIVDED